MQKRRILYVQYANPGAFPPLQHSSRILAKEGWSVLFLGIGSRNEAKLEFPPHPDITVRRFKYCPPGFRQKLHYLSFGAWVCLWTLRWRPLWVYASDPLSCPVALLLSLLPGSKMLYHEHDLPADGARIRRDRWPRAGSAIRAPNTSVRKTRFIRLVLWSRRRLVNRASACVLPNEKRIETFKASTKTPQRVFCVWNCPSLDELKVEDEKDSEIVLHYHGNIGPQLVPLKLVDALVQAPEVRLRLIGYTTLGVELHLEAFQNAVAAAGISQRVEYVPAIPRHDLLEEARRAHIGLALMPRDSRNVNFQNMTGASNKVFDYLACGLALLVSDLPDWTKMFVEPGYGVACDPEDSNSIARALKWFVEHPDETRQMGKEGKKRIAADWNYESQFAVVQKLLAV
jgi:glycosyltransferase involved in cell wall biosynthesis